MSPCDFHMTVKKLGCLDVKLEYIQINGKHCALKQNVIFFSLFGICCILVQKYFGHFVRILFMFLSAENLGFALELSGMHCMQKHDRSPMCLSQYRALSPQINLPAAHTPHCFSKKYLFYIKSYLKTTLNQIDSIFPETFH